MAQHMLTTMDNPWNPWTQWDDWFAYDEQAGYHTTAYLDRVTRSSSELSGPDQEVAYENAVLSAVRENITGIYIMVPNPNGEQTSS